MKQKLKSYTFWVALISAIILVVEEVCKLFGWIVNIGKIENILLSICGVFVVLGIVTKSGTVTNENEEHLKNSNISNEFGTINIDETTSDIDKENKLLNHEDLEDCSIIVEDINIFDDSIK